MFRVISAIIFINLFFISSVSSQEYADKPFSQRPGYGIFGSVDYNMHTASFQGMPQVFSCCPGYESGIGIRYSFGLFYSKPIMDKWDLTIRAAYTDLSALLSKIEPIYLAGPDGFGVDGEFEHSVDATLSSFGLEPLMSLRVSDQLKLHGGLRAGLLLQKSYAQKEELIKPSWGKFYGTDSRIRNNYSGDIPDAASLEAAVVIGASYSMPLNKSFTWFFEPEAFFTYGITPIASGLTWTASSLNVGVAFRYSPRKIIPPSAPPIPPPFPNMPAPPPEVPALEASITAVSVEKDGTENPTTNIRVEEFLSRRVHPLLNYVFFDENSAEIPQRYNRMTEQEKTEFSDKYLFKLQTLEVYHQVLNIVGNRLKKYPNSNITVTGYNSDQGTEKGNIDLSRRRSESVKNFIVNEWGIDPERIKLDARNLPPVPSNQTDPDGIAENRRVEIRTDFPQIFEPLTVRDTLVITNPPLIRFKPKVHSEVGIASWKLITSQQSSGLLKTFSGNGLPPVSIDWDLEKERESVPRLDEDFLYKLQIIDNDNKPWESETQKMPVQAYTIENKFLAMMDGTILDDKEYDQFSLIGFEYYKADVTKEHQPIIDLARKSITKNSKVVIEGYTDRTGTAELNLDLSKRRALAVAKALGIDAKYATGFGKSKLIYDNNFPEGRFYSRTVYIQVETTIKFE